MVEGSIVPSRERDRRKTFREDFRASFLTGVAALLPTILTLWIMVTALGFVDHYIGLPIRRGLLFLTLHAIGPAQIAQHLKQPPRTPPGELYQKLMEQYGGQWYLSVLSFLVAITIVYFVGFLVASVGGRAIHRLIERSLLRLPVIRSVYPYVKQVTDTFFTTRTIKDFNRVVAVEYPRKGLYSLGLVTGSGIRALNDATEEEYLAVYVPSSPAPVTGYTILVRPADIIDLPLTVEQAFKFVISGGVIIPPSQLVVLMSGGRVSTGGGRHAIGAKPAPTSGPPTSDPLVRRGPPHS